MRAKSVNEDLNFERGQDPKDALKIGGNIILELPSGLYYVGPRRNLRKAQELLIDLPREVANIRRGADHDDPTSDDTVLDDISEAIEEYEDGLRELGFEFVYDDDLPEGLDVIEIEEMDPMDLPPLDENLNFERGQEPKEAMGIGMSKELYDKRIQDLRGSVDEETIEDFIIDKAEDMGGAFEMYLSPNDQEELYFLFKLLGKKNIKIKGYDLEDYEKDNDWGDQDIALERAYNRNVQPWLNKGFEIWHEEENGSYVEHILVKYKP